METPKTPPADGLTASTLLGSTGPTAQPADLVIEQVLSAWPDQPVKIRLQPQVFAPTQTGTRSGAFKAWRGLYWNFSVSTIEDARWFRKVLTAALALMVTAGPEEVLRRLTVDTRKDVAVKSATPWLDNTDVHTNTV